MLLSQLFGKKQQFLYTSPSALANARCLFIACSALQSLHAHSINAYKWYLMTRGVKNRHRLQASRSLMQPFADQAADKETYWHRPQRPLESRWSVGRRSSFYKRPRHPPCACSLSCNQRQMIPARGWCCRQGWVKHCWRWSCRAAGAACAGGSVGGCKLTVFRALIWDVPLIQGSRGFSHIWGWNTARLLLSNQRRRWKFTSSLA